MRDAETGTLWNHITGEALYGELVGHRLPVSNLLQMNVSQALALDSDMAVAISDLRDDGSRFDNEELDARFAGTLGEEDLRRPRMDLGVGVWIERIERFYPVEIIRRQGNALIDELDGRNVLVYVDPQTAIPAALFVGRDSGSSGRGRNPSRQRLVRSVRSVARLGRRAPGYGEAAASYRPVLKKFRQISAEVYCHHHEQSTNGVAVSVRPQWRKEFK